MIKMYLHIKMAERRINQRDLSATTGIRPATISAYCNETYKQIVKEHLDILCKFFNCKLEDLIRFEKE